NVADSPRRDRPIPVIIYTKIRVGLILRCRSPDVRGRRRKAPAFKLGFFDLDAAIRSPRMRWRHPAIAVSVRLSNPARRSARERSHLGWDERRYVDGRVSAQSGAPLRRRPKRTERSAVLGPKENAWHLFRTHKRGERSQRRAGGGRAGTVSAGGWGLGRKLPAVDHVCSDARGPSCCSFTIGQIGGITEQRSRLCARSISRPRRKPHLPPL